MQQHHSLTKVKDMRVVFKPRSQHRIPRKKKRKKMSGIDHQVEQIKIIKHPPLVCNTKIPSYEIKMSREMMYHTRKLHVHQNSSKQKT